MQDNLIEFINSSLMLNTPLISKDPAFKDISDNLQDIVEFVATVNGIDLNNINQSDLKRLLLLVRIEIYSRLALASSTQYDFNVQYVGFKKGDRFNHYMTLLESARDELENSSDLNSVYVKNSLISTRNRTFRNYSLGESASINLKATKDSTDILLNWSVIGGSSLLVKYKIAYSKNDFYDEYSINPINFDNVDVIQIDNVRVNKLRIENIDNESIYYVALIAYYSNGTSFIKYLKVGE